MSKKDLFKTIISDWQERKLPHIWERKVKIPINTGKIITLTGVRKSGKTYHLLNLVKRLEKKRIKRKQIFYINFEDERLELKKQDLDIVLQAYRELNPNQDLKDVYFLFDEIQEVDGWEKFVARIFNSISKKIFLTGSNASLLSREIATTLRGKTITFEIYPLSFKEFVKIKKPDLNIYSSKDKAVLNNLFKTFLKQGGFPELLKINKSLHKKVLQEYFNVMIIRDLIERYDIKQAEILKDFCKKAIANSAGDFSVHKIFNEIKSQGYKISKNTLYSFQDYIKAVYLSLFSSKFYLSTAKKELSAKKVYVIDQGFGSCLDYKFACDEGRLLETTIFLELLKQEKEVSYFSNGFECDFVISERENIVELIQSAIDVSDESTKKREIEGLVKTAKRFGLKKGKILTKEQKFEVREKGVSINVLPAWEYFLK